MSEVIKRELTSIAQRLKESYRSTGDEAQLYYYNRVSNVLAILNQEITGPQDLQSVTDQGPTTTDAINVGGVTSDYFAADTAATPALAPGMFAWNDSDGTMDLRLKGNNVTLQLGQENVVRVVNKTGSNLLESEYKVVRVRLASEGGAQGQRLSVVLAQGNNDPDSVTTLGVVTENINNNQEGFVTVFGNVSGINTTGSIQGETWVDGDVLYLSPTVPGKLTKIKPAAPDHTVTMGYVVYAHANQGKIFVKVDNGYELGELHNVSVPAPSDGDILRYNGLSQIWESFSGFTGMITINQPEPQPPVVINVQNGIII